VRSDPRAPRRIFDEDALDQLADSIKCWGQLQPIVVRRTGEAGYQLICGERRWRAHLRAGLETIWAVERDATDHGALALALVENLHRVDLSHAEKVAGLDQLAELAHAQGLRKTAQQLRMDPGWLSRQLSVHRDPIIFPALEAGRIGFGQAAELCRAPQTYREELIERIKAAPGPVSIATLRGWVEQARGNELKEPAAARGKSHPKTGSAEQAALAELVERLEAIGAPRSAEGRAALRRLLLRGHRLLAESVALKAAAPKRSLVELACLMCGERVGTVVDGHAYPTKPGSIARRGRNLLCGRCGGALASDARIDQYVYGATPRALVGAAS
jgi:ParB family chromosome partitioning protein